MSNFFVECESFDKGICALKMFKGSFTFSFESDIDELKLNPKKLEQDIEICKKVQYAILCKFIALKKFQRRGQLCIQNTSLSENKENYIFVHQEKDWKTERCLGWSKRKGRDFARAVDSTDCAVKNGEVCPRSDEASENNN